MQLALQILKQITDAVLFSTQGLLSTVPWPAIAEKQILTIIVNDDDLNYQANVVDIISASSQSVWVTTSYPTPGDKEYVGLVETGTNTGVFTGLLNTSSGLQVLLDVAKWHICSYLSGTACRSHTTESWLLLTALRLATWLRCKILLHSGMLSAV